MTRLTKADKIPFVQVSNEVLYSPALSFKAKGLYAYMLAKPDGWDFCSRRIADETSEGIKAIRSAMKELMDIGILKSQRLKSGHIQYTIYTNIAKDPCAVEIEPESQNDTKDEKPEVDITIVPKSDSGITAPIINKESNKQRDLKNSQGIKSQSFEENGQQSCENSLETNMKGIDMIMNNMKIKRI